MSTNLLDCTSYISALFERLTKDVAVIEGEQVTLNIYNAATHNALQLVNTTVFALNARLSIAETAASNTATSTALEVVNTTLQVINESCVT